MRAEAYISLSDFDRLNAEFAARGEKTYQNPRNTAAGSLRMLDPKVVASRPLRILAYAIVSGNPKSTQWETLRYLKDLGFPVPDIAEKCENIQQVLVSTRKWEAIREKLDYEIDGVVVKLNDLALSIWAWFCGQRPARSDRAEISCTGSDHPAGTGLAYRWAGRGY